VGGVHYLIDMLIVSHCDSILCAIPGKCMMVVECQSDCRMDGQLPVEVLVQCDDSPKSRSTVCCSTKNQRRESEQQMLPKHEDWTKKNI